MLMVVVNVVIRIGLMFTPWLLEWLFVRVLSLAFFVKKKVLDGIERMAQWLALYNRRSRIGLRVRYHRLPDKGPLLPLYDRPDEVRIEIEPSIHQYSPDRRGRKEHAE